MNEQTMRLRRRFQFGISTALCAMTLLAILLTWLRSELNLVHERQAWIESHAKVAWRDLRAKPGSISLRDGYWATQMCRP